MEEKNLTINPTAGLPSNEVVDPELIELMKEYGKVIADQREMEQKATDFELGIFEIDQKHQNFVNSLDSTQVVPKLNVVITYIGKRRALWPPDDVENSRNPPICTSSDCIRPDGDVTKPVSKFCEKCPMNAWGSNPKGGKGKACIESKLLGFYDLDRLGPFSLKVSTMSMKPLNKFKSSFEYKKPTMPGGVPYPMNAYKTVLTLRSEGEGKNTYSVLQFAEAGRLDAATWRTVLKNGETFKAALDKAKVTRDDADAEDAEFERQMDGVKTQNQGAPSGTAGNGQTPPGYAVQDTRKKVKIAKGDDDLPPF